MSLTTAVFNEKHHKKQQSSDNNQADKAKLISIQVLTLLINIDVKLVKISNPIINLSRL